MKIEKYIIGVITLIAVGAIGTAIYFGVNNNDSSNTGNNIFENKNNNLESDSEDVNNVNPITTISIDKAKVNKKLDEELSLPLRYMLDYKVDYFNGVDFNSNYFKTQYNRINFLWYILFLDENVMRLEDIDVNGQEVTGAVAFKYVDILKKYREIFNEDISLDKILANKKLSHKNGYVYGRYVSSWGAPEFLLKAVDIKFDSSNSNYVLTVDFITKGEFEETVSGDNYFRIDEGAYLDYYDYDIVDYPNELVFAKLKITYDENHVLKSLVFEK